MITEMIAESVEAYMEKKLPKLLSASNLGLNIVSIGGKFNDEGIMLEIGLMPIGASPEQARKFLVDRQAEGADIAVSVVGDAPSRPDRDTLFDITRVGLKKSKLRELEAALPSKYAQGSIYIGKSGSYALLGYSDKREGFVLYALERSETVVVPKDKFKKLKLKK